MISSHHLPPVPSNHMQSASMRRYSSQGYGADVTRTNVSQEPPLNTLITPAVGRQVESGLDPITSLQRYLREQTIGNGFYGHPTVNDVPAGWPGPLSKGLPYNATWNWWVEYQSSRTRKAGEVQCSQEPHSGPSGYTGLTAAHSRPFPTSRASQHAPISNQDQSIPQLRTDDETQVPLSTTPPPLPPPPPSSSSTWLVAFMAKAQNAFGAEVLQSRQAVSVDPDGLIQLLQWLNSGNSTFGVDRIWEDVERLNAEERRQLGVIHGVIHRLIWDQIVDLQLHPNEYPMVELLHTLQEVLCTFEGLT